MMKILNKLFKSKPLIKVGGNFMNCDYCGDELLITAITDESIECWCRFCGRKHYMANTFAKGQY